MYLIQQEDVWASRSHVKCKPVYLTIYFTQLGLVRWNPFMLYSKVLTPKSVCKYLGGRANEQQLVV